ncbi:TNFAIP3-interacting protein 1-like isoform X4 [Narcine bancroftii]|uniref:TNFAIP3-interacting protein 1-like isoform X4 n=1 Tax=Narcine bancroftii TaxID=1343680 RepID=UPI0038315F31
MLLSSTHPLSSQHKSSKASDGQTTRCTAVDVSTEVRSWEETMNRSTGHQSEIVSSRQRGTMNEEGLSTQQNVTGMEVGNQESPSTDEKEVFERQIKTLENQRRELLEINKQWDHEFRNMKALYEQKLKEKLTKYQQSLRALEEELDQKQRDFDKNLLLMKARLETSEEEKQTLNAKLLEAEERNKHLKECHSSTVRQKEYYEHEIARLNKALSDALRQQSIFCMPQCFDTTEIKGKSRPEELTTQIEILKQQLKAYEEDFKKERKEKDLLGKKLKKQAREFSPSTATPCLPVAYTPCAPYSNYGHAPFGIPIHCPGPMFLTAQTVTEGYQHPKNRNEQMGNCFLLLDEPQLINFQFRPINLTFFPPSLDHAEGCHLKCIAGSSKKSGGGMGGGVPQKGKWQ